MAVSPEPNRTEPVLNVELFLCKIQDCSKYRNNNITMFWNWSREHRAHHHPTNHPVPVFLFTTNNLEMSITSHLCATWTQQIEDVSWAWNQQNHFCVRIRIINFFLSSRVSLSCQSLCSEVRARRRGVSSVLKLCQKLLQQSQVGKKKKKEPGVDP